MFEWLVGSWEQFGSTSFGLAYSTTTTYYLIVKFRTGERFCSHDQTSVEILLFRLRNQAIE